MRARLGRPRSATSPGRTRRRTPVRTPAGVPAPPDAGRAPAQPGRPRASATHRPGPRPAATSGMAPPTAGGRGSGAAGEGVVRSRGRCRGRPPGETATDRPVPPEPLLARRMWPRGQTSPDGVAPSPAPPRRPRTGTVPAGTTVPRAAARTAPATEATSDGGPATRTGTPATAPRRSRGCGARASAAWSAPARALPRACSSASWSACSASPWQFRYEAIRRQVGFRPPARRTWSGSWTS